MESLSKEEFVHGPGGNIFDAYIPLLVFTAGGYVLKSLINLLSQNK